jgi:hypothetical protein
MTKPLSNVQLEILQSFNYSLDDKDLISFKKMLVNYFADRISDDMDQLFNEKKWDDDQNDKWASEHMRTPYQRDSH